MKLIIVLISRTLLYRVVVHLGLYQNTVVFMALFSIFIRFCVLHVLHAPIHIHCIVCDLVTWSKDKTLRIWGINEELRQSLGGEASEQITIPETMSQQGSDPSLSLSMSLEGEGMESSITPSQAEESLQMSIRSLREGGPSQGSLSDSPTKSLSSMLQSDSQSSLNKSLQSASLYKGHTLEKEFRLLNLDSIPNLELERVSISV